ASKRAPRLRVRRNPGTPGPMTNAAARTGIAAQAPSPAAALARAAADLLVEADAFRKPAGRARHRQLLAEAIVRAGEALRIAEAAGAAKGVRAVGTILTRAHAARAEDARHGAGQLARGSQRAPTTADCDDGWRRVESIVADAEASAAEAVRLAARVPTAAAE